MRRTFRALCIAGLLAAGTALGAGVPALAGTPTTSTIVVPDGTTASPAPTVETQQPTAIAPPTTSPISTAIVTTTEAPSPQASCRNGTSSPAPATTIPIPGTDAPGAAETTVTAPPAACTDATTGTTSEQPCAPGTSGPGTCESTAGGPPGGSTTTTSAAGGPRAQAKSRTHPPAKPTPARPGGGMATAPQIAASAFGQVLPALGTAFSPALLQGVAGTSGSLSDASTGFLIDTFRVPPYLLPIYQAAAIDYGVPWTVLAAINEVETDYGRNLSTSAAGAMGFMQFMPATWKQYGIDADGLGAANPYDPVDAIFAAARYLSAAGAGKDLAKAIFAYNHAAWYVTSVRLRAELLQLLPGALVSGLTGLMQSRFPIAGHLGADASAQPTTAKVGSQVAATVSAPAGAAVVAVADARVVAIGHDRLRGRYLTLQDAYGNRFTYSGLGDLQASYPVLTPEVDSHPQIAADLGVAPQAGTRSPTAAATATAYGPEQTPPAAATVPAAFAPQAKVRLFADPSRPNSFAAGGSQQIAESGLSEVPAALSDYFSQSVTLAPGEYTLAPLRVGASVVAGTILGRVGAGESRSTGITLQIQPVGASAPVDPRPIISGWALLGRLTPKTAMPGAFGASSPSLGQLLLADKSTLQQRVLSDPRVQIYACGRRDIAAGLVDRRVLAAIEYLSYIGFAPGVGGLVCGQAPQAGMAAGATVSIARLDGKPVAGNQQPGGTVEQAIRRLLQLQGALAPERMVSTVTIPGQAATIALPDHASSLEVDYAAPAVLGASAGVTTAQWQRLMSRLAALGGLPGQAAAYAPVSTATTPAAGPVSTTAPAAATVGPAPAAPAVAPVRAHARPAHPLAGATAPAIAGSAFAMPLAPALRLFAAQPHRLGARSSATAPSVTMTGPPPTDIVAGQGLNQTVTLTAMASATGGRTIASVSFAIEASGSNNWRRLLPAQTVASGGVYSLPLDTTLYPNGPYDFRATATDSAGEQSTDTITNLIIVNNSFSTIYPPGTFMMMADPGSPLRGSVQLRAAADQFGFAIPTDVSFQVSQAGRYQWRTVATAAFVDAGIYGANWDTAAVPDGLYDIRVVADDKPASDQFDGEIISSRLVDDTPPSLALTAPSGPQSGQIELSARASDGGSGINAVKYEVAAPGSGDWTTVATAQTSPYAVAFDTRSLADGTYDLRAEAADEAGNVTTSAIGSLTVANPSRQSFDNFSITKYAAPASNVSLLGEVAGSSQHETWAYGLTNAPPPVVDGAPLPYTQSGNGQLVLLRYLDSTGWEIADVLRNADGSAWQQPAGQLEVSGAMTASGEAWLAVSPGQRMTMFHRAPGGQFLLDDTGSTSATQAALAPFGTIGAPGSMVTIRLGQTADGSQYGVEISPSQTPIQEPGQTPWYARLQYGSLEGGSWTLKTAQLPPGSAPTGRVTLTAADTTGPGAGWGVIDADRSSSLTLARFDGGGWHYGPSGLDVLDSTGPFAAAPPTLTPGPTATPSGQPYVTATGLRADSGGVWVSATVTGTTNTPGSVLARYDASSTQVQQSWCNIGALPATSWGCVHSQLQTDTLPPLPDATFDTPSGRVADALGDGAVEVYQNGGATSVPFPGFQGGPGQSLFTSPTEGWIVGPGVIARLSSSPAPNPLALWPQANRATLTSAALPPGQSTTATPGAIAVGLGGTALHYDPQTGWVVDRTPTQIHHLGLFGVAFNGPSSAFAVGQFGAILHWDGSTWTPDPQSQQLTTTTLRSVAFRADGQGWAVGGLGTILHYDGHSWSAEQPDDADATDQFTSVAVSGTEVYAIGNGNLFSRAPDGSWAPVDRKTFFPAPTLPQGNLQLVAGLADGGLVVAAKHQLLVRQSATDKLAYIAQSFEGIPVALAPFRDAGGQVRTFMSLAQPITTISGPVDATGGVPSGDGNLLLQSTSGWDDLSQADVVQHVADAAGDGIVHPDPVLAVASSPDGTHAWAVGGFTGTRAADGVGVADPLTSRPAGWLSSSIWRYDAGGSVAPPPSAQAGVSLPATPGTVSFAFFSSAYCKSVCVQTVGAQPDVNVRSAAGEIAGFAQQPGGPLFAVDGGNLRDGAPQDIHNEPALLSPLGSVPLYAAYGPVDGATVARDPRPWAAVFAGAPQPFGTGPAPAGIAPIGGGDAVGRVNRYYAFDATQNGGTLRVIVLDNSKGSLEESAPGQTAWLASQLADAQSKAIPVVVFAAQPLDSSNVDSATDADQVATMLANVGVLAVFTTSGYLQGPRSQLDAVVQVPANAPAGAPQIPDYEGATLTYQQLKNDGVTWYDVSVDTVGLNVSVNAVPVVSTIAIEPLKGLTTPQSATLTFAGIGRRPPATIATTPGDPDFPGYDQYVEIPGATCGTCVTPSYSFTSADPSVGDFVAPVSPGSSIPKLNGKGKPVLSAQSTLFCGFNPGTTTITLTVGLQSTTLPVTVTSGNVGPPCGTVPSTTHPLVSGVGKTRVLPARNPGLTIGGLKAGGTSPSPAPAIKITLPAAPKPVAPAPPPPPPAPKPPAKRVIPASPVITPISPFIPGVSSFSATPSPAVPPIPPASPPIPPGGATASAAAKREEKARKHAQSSAYMIRPAGSGFSDFFYPAIGVVGLIALLLAAEALPPRARSRYAYSFVRDEHWRR